MTKLCIKWRDKTGMVSGTQGGGAGGAEVHRVGQPASRQTNGIPLLLTAERGEREERLSVPSDPRMCRAGQTVYRPHRPGLH